MTVSENLIEDPAKIVDLFRGGSDISSTLALQNLKKISGSMIKQSIRRRIVAIVVGLTILMVAISVLSMVMVGRVGHLLDELSVRYTPVNAHLTQLNALSLERALALRRMIIAKMQDPPDVIGYRARKEQYVANDAEVEREAQAARKLINAIIDDTSTPSDNAALARVESRIDSLMSQTRRHLGQEQGELLSELDAGDFAAVRRSLARVDSLRDELDKEIAAVRTEMVTASLGAIETLDDLWRVPFLTPGRLYEMQLRILWEEILKRGRTIEVVGEPERVYCRISFAGIAPCRSEFTPDRG
jgi:hypothetical protein